MTKPSAVNIHRTNPPDWFKQADFGIIIHWGPYSVPAYAPVNIPDYGTLIKTKSLGYLFEHQPYAEWYGNSMLLPSSPVAAYHRTHYGNTSYADFAKGSSRPPRMSMCRPGPQHLPMLAPNMS